MLGFLPPTRQAQIDSGLVVVPGSVPAVEGISGREPADGRALSACLSWLLPLCFSNK